MAVSESAHQDLTSQAATARYELADEPQAWTRYLEQGRKDGASTESAWRSYVRNTHARRSAARLLTHLNPISRPFASVIASITEAHVLNIDDIRDNRSISRTASVFGQSIDLHAIALYLRIVNLLDIGEDRTPYHLWRFVDPRDDSSRAEWNKHRSISPVSVDETGPYRQIRISAIADTPGGFAALADLKSYVDSQFADDITYIQSLEMRFRVPLSPHIQWDITTQDFQPILSRFEPDRAATLELLATEIYSRNPHAFVRELLQNSVDALDAKSALLGSQGAVAFDGRIHVVLRATESGIEVTWTDNGVGMTESIIQRFLARIGRSWYRSAEFDRLGVDVHPISRFGIGMLACFAVSRSMVITTRADRAIDVHSVALTIGIPTKDAHFHISHGANIDSGTRINLTVDPGLAASVSIASIVASIQRDAGFVRYSLSIDRPHQPPIDITPWDSPLHISGETGCSQQALEAPPRPLFEDGAEALDDAVRAVIVRLGGGGRVFDGIYRAFVPADHVGARRVGNDFQVPGGVRVISSDYAPTDEGSGLFVKGVRAAPGFPQAYEGFWLDPLVAINVTRPELVSPHVDREGVREIEVGLVAAVWRDIVHAFISQLTRLPTGAQPRDVAAAVGSAHIYGGAPLDAIAKALDDDVAPVVGCHYSVRPWLT